MAKKRVIVIVVFVCAAGLMAFMIMRQKNKLPKLPEKESLKLSEYFSVEDIHYTEGIVEVKFSNSSEKENHFYYIEAKGLEVWQEGGWKELHYIRREDYIQYGVEPDWRWLKYGNNDDDEVNLITRNITDTWLIKTAKEDYGVLEKGEYRVFYIVSDDENELEIAYRTFSVE